MKKTTIKNIIASAICILIGTGATAQMKYDEIITELPNWSLDQAYSELMSFQRGNPMFANTYIQLGIICEHKMALTDPLRDIKKAQFWSDNAHLYYGNFGVFYKEGDYRKNEEYYENISIPSEGKKVTDADVKAFVAEHEKKCRNFRDTTKMIYNAIESSKSHYNKCIMTYTQLCNQYSSYNEMLLGYNKDVAKMIASIDADYDSCITKFAEYKRLTKSYPILNYRQLYDTKIIETFRLDGLTNSDFYENRFTIWDFKKWTSEYNATIENHIKPLRKQIEDINGAFAKQKAEVSKVQPTLEANNQPFDEKFIFKLGKFDNSSLVRELMNYLETRRHFYQLVADSITFNTDTISSKVARKMRHAYNTAIAAGEAKDRLIGVEAFVTEDRIVRFKEFFEKRYNGANGIHQLQQSEPKEIDALTNSMALRLIEYVRNVEIQDSINAQIDKLQKNKKGKNKKNNIAENNGISAYSELTNITRTVVNAGVEEVSYYVTDSLGKKQEPINLTMMHKATHIQNVKDAAIVMGENNGRIIIQKVNDNGVTNQPTTISGQNLKIGAILRASAKEICLFISDANNGAKIVVIDDEGVVRRNLL